MQVEISDRVYTALIKQASEHHLTVEAWLESQIDLMERRKEAAERMTAFMQTNTATSGRGSMDWREYIHQGHAY